MISPARFSFLRPADRDTIKESVITGKKRTRERTRERKNGLESGLQARIRTRERETGKTAGGKGAFCFSRSDYIIYPKRTNTTKERAKGWKPKESEAGSQGTGTLQDPESLGSGTGTP